MAQPGPGEVLRFAEEVKSGWRETERTGGVRVALEWVLGESNKHPVSGRSPKRTSKPPTMREIKRACGEARTTGRKVGRVGTRAPRDGSSSSADYLRGRARVPALDCNWRVPTTPPLNTARLSRRVPDVVVARDLAGSVERATGCSRWRRSSGRVGCGW
jgi:hypothetical protein